MTCVECALGWIDFNEYETLDEAKRQKMVWRDYEKWLYKKLITDKIKDEVNKWIMNWRVNLLIYSYEAMAIIFPKGFKTGHNTCQ